MLGVKLVRLQDPDDNGLKNKNKKKQKERFYPETITTDKSSQIFYFHLIYSSIFVWIQISTIGGSSQYKFTIKKPDWAPAFL